MLLCDRRGWAYDLTARNLATHLADQFNFEIAYVAETPEIDEGRYDLVYVFWWGETYHRKFLSTPGRIVKEISSHRWQYEDRYGRHTPGEALDRFMHDAGYLVATSERLLGLFSGHHSNIYHYPLGVDTDFFRPLREKTGPLRIGWAGNINDPKKRVNDILLPAGGDSYQLALAEGGLGPQELLEFYNELDVICVAATEEGTPLPLIEAMACGCFPVATDVGVVPEIVKHGQNGLIVEPTAQAFREAFDWCQCNLDVVRHAGRANTELIRGQRSWQHSAQQFAVLLHEILRISKESVELEGVEDARVPSPRAVSDRTAGRDYRSSCLRYAEEIVGLLPESREERILQVGFGAGHFLNFLADKNYQRVVGIDPDPLRLLQTRAFLGHRVEKLVTAGAKDFLKDYPEAFDCIVLLDQLEGLDTDQLKEFLVVFCEALKPGGRLILRSHLANERGLLSLLEQAGFRQSQIHCPVYTSKCRQLDDRLQQIISRSICLFAGHARPMWFGRPVIVSARR